MSTRNEARRRLLNRLAVRLEWDRETLSEFLATVDLDDSKQLHEATRDMYHLIEYKAWVEKEKKRDEVLGNNLSHV